MPDIAENPRLLNLLALLLLIPAGIYLVKIGLGLSAALAALGAAQGFAMAMERRRLDFAISAGLLLWIGAALLWGLILLLRGEGLWPLLILKIFSIAPAACAALAFKALRPARRS